jgi:multidrug efflux pump subunit AcrA (membrane-fusion protein)
LKPGKIIIFLLVIFLAGTGVFFWWNSTRETGETTTATAKVIRRNLNSSVLATGAVKPQVGAEVRVGARISGKVEKLYANIGDQIAKDKVIAELEKRDLEARAAEQKARLDISQTHLASLKNVRPVQMQKEAADVAKWQVTADVRKKEMDRSKSLFEKKVLSQEDYDRAAEQYEVSMASLESAQKVLELDNVSYIEDMKQAVIEIEFANASLAEAQVQISYATITAPMSGVIASVSTQEGETVSAGLSAPTFVTIIDLARLQVDAYVDEVDIGKVKPGQTAQFTVDSFPSREFEGKVIAIYPKAVIQENVVNYDVVVEITTPYDGLLRPEMTASVTIMLEAKENVLVIPVKAVKRERGKSVVYIIVNGKTQPREVKVGWKDSQWIEVISGVEEGQTILVDAPSAEQPPASRN